MPTSLPMFIWFFLRKHKLAQVLILCITIIVSLEISCAPYILKVIIDTANAPFDNKIQFLDAIWPFTFIYVFLTVVHNVAIRAIEKIYIELFPKIRSEIYVTMFDHLSDHPLIFFQQNLSGDLANKISMMADGIETTIKIIIQYIIGNVCTVVIASALLWTVHSVFAFILLSWAGSSKLKTYSYLASAFLLS
jgi:ATP-binding cassette subfamily B protein